MVTFARSYFCVAAMSHTLSTFSLEDEAADRFYGNGVYVSDAPQVPRVVEQFEVDESDVTPGLTHRAYNAADISKYTNLFDVTVSDVVFRLKRACFPCASMFDPPAVPVHTAAEPDAEDADGASRSDEGFATPVDSVGYVVPLSTEADLYGAIWIPVSLILATAMGSNMYMLLSAVVKRKDVFHEATMSSVDFSGLVACASGVSLFVFLGSLSIFAMKRYWSDPEQCSLSFALCVFGYSLAPVVPGVLLCSVLRGSWTWFVIFVCVSASCACALRNFWRKANFFPSFLRVEAEAGADLEETDAPDLAAFGTMRTVLVTPLAVWWLRIGVVFIYLFAGFALKLRFF